MNKNILTILFLFALVSSLAVAVPGDWAGLVTIDTVPAGTDVNVAVYSGSTQLDDTTTPTISARGDNYYILVFEAANGEALKFKVCGIEDTAAATTFTSGSHTLNLDVSKQADGTYGCTCDDVCTGGNCVNPGYDTGVCSSNTHYCDADGTCETDYGETSALCPSDCASSSSGSSGGGGGVVEADPHISHLQHLPQLEIVLQVAAQATHQLMDHQVAQLQLEETQPEQQKNQKQQLTQSFQEYNTT